MKNLYETPKIEKKEEKQDYVFEQFHNVDFPIEEFPEIFERVIELANMPSSHFDDAVKMSQIVELLWNDIEKEGEFNLSIKELKLACLFHDIGKSGPADASREERMMIEQIFNPTFFRISSEKFKNAVEFKDKEPKEASKVIRTLPIAKVLEIENLPNKDKIIEYLKTLQLHVYNEETNSCTIEDVDPQKHDMITLWREHDIWTWQTLKEFGGNKISQELKIIASTHHTLEGHDPAALGGKVPDEAIALETIDKYSIITLVDKYQAFIVRSNVDHQQAIKILENLIRDSKAKNIINHEDKVFNKFMKYLKILDRHPEIAENF